MIGYINTFEKELVHSSDFVYRKLKKSKNFMLHRFVSGNVQGYC